MIISLKTLLTIYWITYIKLILIRIILKPLLVKDCEEIKIASNEIIDILDYCSNENAAKSNYFYSIKILLSFSTKS